MLSNTQRTKIKKAPHKAVADPKMLHSIIDESLLAHVGITDAGESVVIPMLCWRVENQVYVHGARNSRLIKSLLAGGATCLTFTLFDGWVLARSAFSHSAHYRSAMVFGQFSEIENTDQKHQLLSHFLEQIAPGRSQVARPGNSKEMAATVLLEMSLDEASVKVSNKGVNDKEEDLASPIWAGVMPYRTIVGPLVTDPNLGVNLDIPDYSSAYSGRWGEER